MLCRWLLRRGHRGDLHRPLPGGEETGMGSLLHSVALLGHGVSRPDVAPLQRCSSQVTLRGMINVNVTQHGRCLSVNDWCLGRAALWL